MPTGYARYGLGVDQAARPAIYCITCSTELPIWPHDEVDEQANPTTLADWIAITDEHERQRHTDYTPPAPAPASAIAREVVRRLVGPAVLGGNLPATYEEADRILAELTQAFAQQLHAERDAWHGRAIGLQIERDALASKVAIFHEQHSAAYASLRSFAEGMASLATTQLKLEPGNQAWKAVDDCARQVLAAGILRRALESPQKGVSG